MQKPWQQLHNMHLSDICQRLAWELLLHLRSISHNPKSLTALQGHWSPIVRQMRGSTKPDGMCLVVGSCASGFAPEQNR